jgi:hypothetical protein
MLSPLDTRFDRRWRSEGMVESICTVCSEIVCREPALLLAEEFEAAHECTGSAELRSWMQLESTQA